MTPDPIIPARFRSGQISHNVTRPRRHPMTAARTLGLLLLTTAAAAAAPRGPLSFARDIRPILSNNCVMCHGPDEAERKGGPSGSGGLRLDTEEGARMLLDGGKKAVVPGHPEHSDIIARIMHFQQHPSFHTLLCVIKECSEDEMPCRYHLYPLFDDYDFYGYHLRYVKWQNSEPLTMPEATDLVAKSVAVDQTEKPHQVATK